MPLAVGALGQNQKGRSGEGDFPGALCLEQRVQ